MKTVHLKNLIKNFIIFEIYFFANFFLFLHFLPFLSIFILNIKLIQKNNN